MYSFISTTTFTLRSSKSSSCNLSTSLSPASPIKTTFLRPHPYIKLSSQKTSSPKMTLSPLTTITILSDFSEVNRSSLFATAFVFFLTLWGSVSFVKGSTKPRITQASFTIRDSASSIARKTTRYLLERSFTADPAADSRDGVMTFRGQVRASTSIASILVAVVGSSLWTLTYVLNFVLPQSLQSPYWGSLTLLAFAIVPWYWKAASRSEEVKVMVEEDDGLSTLYVKGHRDEISELETAFQWKRDEPVYEDEKEKQTVASGTTE